MRYVIRRLKRFYCSPDQTRLEQILGATTITFGCFRDDRGYPLTITLNRGHLLRSERFRRSVLDDMGVLANDVRMAIALQGSDYEQDVVMAYERDAYLRDHGWAVKYIPVTWLDNPLKVREAIGRFI